MPDKELILYSTDDGLARVQPRDKEGTVWLTQAEIAELFATAPQNITQHVRALYAEGELAEAATCKARLQVQTEGARVAADAEHDAELKRIEAEAVAKQPRSPR